VPLRCVRCAFLTFLLAVVAGWTLDLSDPVGSAGSSVAPMTSPGAPPPTTTPPTSQPATTSPPPLRAPRTTSAQDAKFFADVAEADGALASYEQKQQNVALRALLTDGTAFCALVTRGGSLNAALVAEAMGARSTESQTHLPLSVTTFNTIESVALLALCPSEQKLVPASTRSKIRALGKALAKRTG
jgi:hypothetical protein